MSVSRLIGEGSDLRVAEIESAGALVDAVNEGNQQCVITRLPLLKYSKLDVVLLARSCGEPVRRAWARVLSGY